MDIDTSNPSPADIYERKFVPALFGPWGSVMARAAAMGPGHSILDVGCGTGALTCAAADIVGPDGSVVGLDPNPLMLAVARRKSGAIEWVEGVAEKLPFEDGRFDAVVSQFACMFFDDRPRALSEMMRVARSGGMIVVAVCGDVNRSPGYAAFASLLDRLFGREVGDAFRAPFVLGDPDALRRIALEAGFDAASIEEKIGSVRFATVEDLVSTERACVWTLGGILDDAQFDVLLRNSRTVLKQFEDEDGKVRFDMPALILTAQKPY